jgi:hypothetical protein
MAAQPEPFVPRVVDDVELEASRVRDRETVELRTAGKSYSSIAKKLGLTSARDAHEAFARDVRRRPAKERDALRSAESERLEALATKTQGRTDLDKTQKAKRLRNIERLRQTLMMD